MKLKLKTLVMLAGFISLAGHCARADVRLPAVFGDHMVLQRGIKVPVWGWADSGEAVSVSFADQHKTAVADASGKWRVTLDPIADASSTPGVLKISGHNTVNIEDVLVGDVWVCSGQSNMQLQVKAAANGTAEVAAANHPLIRLLQVEHFARGTEQDDMGGQWSACTPKSAANFSAAGYYFGRNLQEAIKVPIGLIHSSWGGTLAEAWTAPESLQGNPILQPILTRYQNAMTLAEPKMSSYRKAYAEWAVNAYPKDPGNLGLANGWASDHFDDSDWTATKVPVQWSDVPGIDVIGTVWFRTSVDIPAELVGKDLSLHLGAIDDCDITYFNGQQVGSTWVDVPDAREVLRNYTIPASLVHTGKNVIAIRAFNIVWGGAICGPATEMYVCPQQPGVSTARLSLSNQWSCKLEQKLQQNNKAGPEPERPVGPETPGAPSNLFNGMIKPIIPFAIKGVIWYQGEGNAGRGYQYRTLLPALIQGWRARWNQGNFPFLIVQLPNFNNPSPEIVSNEAWPDLREAQLYTVRTVPQTGLAVTIDIGEHQIHPVNKQDVGKRLAWVALEMVYHQKSPGTGPLFLSSKIEGDHIVVSFDHVSGGLVQRKGVQSLTGFAIAGADHKFVSAEARIEGDTVIVSSPQVPHPVAARYLWSNNPPASLFDGDGLPASPFRTDDWPLVTQDKQ